MVWVGLIEVELLGPDVGPRVLAPVGADRRRSFKEGSQPRLAPRNTRDGGCRGGEGHVHEGVEYMPACSYSDAS